MFGKILDDPAAWMSSIHIAALGFSAGVSLYAIFLFLNRVKQQLFVKIASGFQVIALGTAFGVILSLGGIGSYLWDEALSLSLIFIGIVSQLLALRGIKKDDKLVRSMDRIR
jgi:hypothetical protein